MEGVVAHRSATGRPTGFRLAVGGERLVRALSAERRRMVNVYRFRQVPQPKTAPRAQLCFRLESRA